MLRVIVCFSVFQLVKILKVKYGISYEPVFVFLWQLM